MRNRYYERMNHRSKQQSMNSTRKNSRIDDLVGLISSHISRGLLSGDEVDVPFKGFVSRYHPNPTDSTIAQIYTKLMGVLPDLGVYESSVGNFTEVVPDDFTVTRIKY